MCCVCLSLCALVCLCAVVFVSGAIYEEGGVGGQRVRPGTPNLQE